MSDQENQTVETQANQGGGAQGQEGAEGQAETNNNAALGGTAEGQAEEKKDPEKQEKDNNGEGEEDYELFGKPEAYDYKDIKLPENIQLDEDMTGKFNEYATKLNLSQKGANDLMAMAVELTEQTHKRTVEAMGKLTEAKIEGYKQLLNSDSEVGGANYKESIATANLAYDAFFADEGLRELMAESGLTVHPKMIKALRSIGLQMQQDKIHNTGSASGTAKSREDIMFPSMAEN